MSIRSKVTTLKSKTMSVETLINNVSDENAKTALRELTDITNLQQKLINALVENVIDCKNR